MAKAWAALLSQGNSPGNTVKLSRCLSIRVTIPKYATASSIGSILPFIILPNATCTV
jgi:hypothetical protein